jgi:hypothetical protein
MRLFRWRMWLFEHIKLISAKHNIHLTRTEHTQNIKKLKDSNLTKASLCLKCAMCVSSEARNLLFMFYFEDISV